VEHECLSKENTLDIVGSHASSHEPVAAIEEKSRESQLRDK